ncbi:MAG: outer membrane protein assembly factor BamA, partial [Bacteroidetes bacterium]|nr:outer membrane protein assembly factor BamA [Bacteroidota bacterium]
MSFISVQAQNLDEYVKGKSYTIDTITVSGIKTFSDQTVISYSQLRKGQKINIPGDDVSAVINKLWGLQLFSDINFYITNIDGDLVSLEIQIEELPILGEVKIKGLKKG